VSHAKRDADDLQAQVMAKVGTTDRNQVTCPRARNYMTPCIARDGQLALADDNVCVGCGQSPKRLLSGLRGTEAR
jgi:hypothetical protein